jgi:hypothetical protein
MNSNDGSVTIPPDKPDKQRRRSADHIDWIRVAKYVLLSLPMWGPATWKIGEMLFAVHSQWIVFQGMSPRIEELETTSKEHADLAKRLASLERYRCILGYDPGGRFGEKTVLPRDRRNECRTAIPEMAAAPAPMPPAADRER